MLKNYLVDTEGNVYIVPTGKVRLVSFDTEDHNFWSCSCPAGNMKPPMKCKHYRTTLKKKEVIDDLRKG